MVTPNATKLRAKVGKYKNTTEALAVRLSALILFLFLVINAGINSTGYLTLSTVVPQFHLTLSYSKISYQKLHAHHLGLVATRDGDQSHGAGGRGTGGPGIGMPKSESGATVEARLEKVLRRLGLEGRALDGMKWVYFYYGVYFRVLTLGGQEKLESCGFASGRSAIDRR